MKKCIALLVVVCLCISMFAGCGVKLPKGKKADADFTDIEDIDVFEDDDEDTKKPAKKKAKTFNLGEEWVVDDEWSLVVTGVTETAERNEYDESDPGAVYIVEYTYKNLGYEDEYGDGLYIFLTDTIVDSEGEMGNEYPLPLDNYPQEVPIGATCKNAQCCIGVNNAGGFELTVSMYDSCEERQKAVFVIDEEDIEQKKKSSKKAHEDDEDEFEEEPDDDEDESKEEEKPKGKSKDSKSGSGKAAIQDAFDGHDASEDNPVPLGEWAEITMYNAVDGVYRTVYFRITGITTQSDDADYIDDCIDEHNSYAGKNWSIDLADAKLPHDVEPVIVDYEVYIPDDFNVPSYGPDADYFEISFNARNNGGGGFPGEGGAVIYYGLGSQTRLESHNDDETFDCGDTVTNRSLFSMPIGYTDYEFRISTYEEGHKVDGDYAYEIYLAPN